MNEQFPEFRDQNCGRAYPFDENASRTSTDGLSIPNEWLLDLFATIPQLTGRAYLSRVSLDDLVVEFSDAKTRKVVMSCELPKVPGPVDLYDTTPYQRKLGVAVFGPAVSEFGFIGGEAVYRPAAAPLVPAAALPLTGTAVNGLDVDDRLMVGDVQIEGENSIVAYTYVDAASGQSRLRVGVMGEALPEVDCYDDDCTTPIRCLRVKVESGSPIAATKAGDNRLVLTTAGFDLSDLCPTPPEKKPLPSEQPDRLCEPEEEEEPEPYQGADAAEFDICAVGGQLFIDTPDALGYRNPLDTQVETVPSGPPLPVPDGASSREQLERQLEASREALSGLRGQLRLRFRT